MLTKNADRNLFSQTKGNLYRRSCVLLLPPHIPNVFQKQYINKQQQSSFIPLGGVGYIDHITP